MFEWKIYNGMENRPSVLSLRAHVSRIGLFISLIDLASPAVSECFTRRMAYAT